MDQNALAGVGLFEGMSEEELERCARSFESIRVLMGDRVAQEDDYGYSFFIVLDGRVRVSRDGEDVAELSAGDHFGEVSLVTGDKRNATVTALESCHLAKIMTWDFDELMAQNETLGTRIKEVADQRS